MFLSFPAVKGRPLLVDKLSEKPSLPPAAFTLSVEGKSMCSVFVRTDSAVKGGRHLPVSQADLFA